MLREKIKYIIKNNLSQDKVERLSNAKKYSAKLLSEMSGSIDHLFDDPIYSRTEYEDLNRIAKYYNKCASKKEKEFMIYSLMGKVMSDVRYGKILESEYLKNVFNNQSIYKYALGIGQYSNGNVEKAMQTFKEEINNNAAPFAYLCLSRCQSAGLGDDNKAIEILLSGLERHPKDYSLTLSIASAYFRLGNTKRANEYLNTIEEELKILKKSEQPGIDMQINEINTALSQKITIRGKGNSRDRYTEEYSEKCWNALWYRMNLQNRFQHGWAWLNYLYDTKIEKILRELDPGIRTVINFGVYCANPDYLLAKKFPNTKFIGVDRERITKSLNERAFNLPNLHFFVADIMDILPSLPQKGSPSLLFHARTGTLCYPEFLRNLYKSCANSGIEYISLFENASLSRDTLKFHDYENMPSDSICYRSVMFIHNYRKILDDAGYKIIESERLQSMTLIEKDAWGDNHVFLTAKLK